MAPVRLTLACGNYDRTRALMEGTVKPRGIDLTYVQDTPHHLFERVLIDGEFDAAEMSVSNLTTLVARGDRRFVAIPVFPSRVFRHGYIFVNADAGIGKPQDLVGRRVGVPEYSMTAAVWIRALLRHEYGVLPAQIDWRTGGLDRPGKKERIQVRLPQDVKLDPIAGAATLGKALERGEIDALICASVPEVFKRRSPKVRRLFPNYHEIELDYHRRTGLVPIMHTVVIRTPLYEANPWIAKSLTDAFCEAKTECIRGILETGAPQFSLTFLHAYLEQERAVFGDDHWPYGLEPNRKSLEALVSYVHEQGLSERRVAVEELFAKEALVS
jgi:4,5-dihydroxyphthalate decarboxylase